MITLKEPSAAMSRSAARARLELGAEAAQCIAVCTVFRTLQCVRYLALQPYTDIRTEIPVLMHILRHLWVCSVARKSHVGSHKPVVAKENIHYEFNDDSSGVPVSLS